MNCSHYRSELMECARTLAPPPPHITGCAACASFYNDQLALSSRLRGLPALDAPPDLKPRVLAALEKVRDRPSLSLGWRLGAALTLAAALGVGIAIVPWQPAAPVVADQPFIEIPYVAPLAPYERAEVRHMDVPVAALIAAGFEFSARQTAASVPADVLLGQDGRIHAIRLIHN